MTGAAAGWDGINVRREAARLAASLTLLPITSVELKAGLFDERAGSSPKSSGMRYCPLGQYAVCRTCNSLSKVGPPFRIASRAFARRA